ncbi:MAG: pilus assembly protein PilM [Candidatus Omnitrophota bacterium]
MKIFPYIIPKEIKDKILGLWNSCQKKPKRFLAIDFRQAQIEIVYVETTIHGLQLLRHQRQASLSPENYDAAAVRFIRDFIQKNSIADHDVVLSISDANSVIVKYLTLPVVPRSEILEAAKWQLKDEIPFDLESALVDWQIVKEETDQEGAKKNGIIFIIVKKEIVDRYLSLATQCRLKCFAVTSGSFHYAQLLKDLSRKPGISAILDIDDQDSTLNIYVNHQLSFVRKLPFSWEKLMRSLTQTLVTAEGKVGLSLEEAQEIIRDCGIVQNETQPIKNNIQSTHIISLMRPLLENLLREIKLSVGYFTSTFNSSMPSQLYISGGAMRLKHLDEFLHAELKMNVAWLPLPTFLDRKLSADDPKRDDYDQIIHALAACLRDSKDINLLPPELKTQKAEEVQRASLRLLAVTAGSIFLILFLIDSFQMRDYEKRLKVAQSHLGTIKGMEALGQKIALKQEAINKIQMDRIPANGLLKTVSVLVPAEIILNEISFQQSGHSLSLKGTLISGGTQSETALTHFMEELEASSFLTEASLISSKRVGDGMEFEIKCDLAKEERYD